MADLKISQLNSIVTVVPATDVLPVVQGGTTLKITPKQILESGSPAVLASATITGAATVGTTLGVTGAATFTGAVVCNGAVTLGDAVGDAITATGSFTSYTGQNPSAIRAAASDYAAVTFDGTTASTRITSTLTGQNIGTGDFSLWSRFRVPALAAFANGSSVIGLGPNAADSFGNSCCRLTLLSGGILSFRITDSGSALTNGDIANFSTNFSGQVVDVVVTRTGSTLKIYINGTDTAYTGTPAASTSIDSVYCHTGIGANSATIFTGRIYRSVVFNRALSASDVTELITVGVNPADQWGTQTAVVSGATGNGDFESWTTPGTAGSSNGSITGWLITPGGSGSTVTRNASSPISGVYDALLTNAGVTGVGIYTSAGAPVLLINKRYRASWSILRVSGTQNAIFVNGGTNTLQKTTTLTTGTTVNDSVEFVSTSTNVGFSTPLVSPATTFQLDNVEITRIGAIVDLDFTVGTGYQATDRSTNSLHGTLFNGVAFTQPRQMAVLYATTSTSGNQQMLGTLAIPTNAVIEDIICNSTGSATVSVGNASAGTQIVNGASVVAGRQKLTLATPFSTTGNLWVNSSTTATLQFTILYTIAA